MRLLKALIIYNPKSGNAIDLTKINEICSYLKNYEVSIFYSNFEKEITSYLFLNAKRFELIIVFGGDGTLHEAINGIMRSNANPYILYIPKGSVNDFAKHIGIKKKYQKELEILKYNPQKIDVYQIDNEYFIYTIGCGKFTSISYDKKCYFLKKYLKRFYYYLKLFKDLLITHKYEIEVYCDNEKYNEEVFIFLFLAINNIAGFKVRGAKNKIDDGKIKLYLFKYHKLFSSLNLLFFYLFKRKSNYFIKEIESDCFVVKSNKLLKLNLDGEGPIYKDEFIVRVIPKRLNFYIKKN